MKFILKTCILLIFLPSALLSQNFEGGLTCGLVTYKGDLIDELVEFKATHLAYGAVLRGHINDKISVRANFLAGELSGNDAFSKSVSKQQRQLRFRSDIYELSIQGEWNPFGKDRSDIHGNLIRQKITPYFFGGFGLVIFDPEVFQGDTKDPEGRDYQTFNLTFPAGGGIKIGLNEQFVFGVEVGGRTAWSDYLDGISKLGNPSGKDWYWIGNITLTYSFGTSAYF